MNNKLVPEDLLRTLAKSYYWQIIYNRAKELGHIKLFENESDFSYAQILFLQYLESISSLYIDLAMGENLITEEVINDWIRAESYLLYKRKKREEQQLKGTNHFNDQSSPPTTDKIVFLKRNKKRK